MNGSPTGKTHSQTSSYSPRLSNGFPDAPNFASGPPGCATFGFPAAAELKLYASAEGGGGSNELGIKLRKNEKA